MEGSNTAKAVLDQVTNPSSRVQSLRKEWESKDPHEKAAAGQQLFNGVLRPALYGDYQPTKDEIEEISVIFESCFQSLEQASMTRGASSSR